MKLPFSIRDLLWLTLVVAMAVVWWLDHRHVAQQLNFCIEALDETTLELEHAQTDAKKKVDAYRRSAFEADRRASKAKIDAAISQEQAAPLVQGPYLPRNPYLPPDLSVR